MKLSRKAILDKTHYGLNVYAFVLRQFYPNTTVLTLKGRDCGITCNPYNHNKKTLKIEIENNIAIHHDTEVNTFSGDVFDFANLYYKTENEIDLLKKLNQELHLNLKMETEKHEKKNYIQCSFFKAPVRNVFPAHSLTLYEIFHLIACEKYKEITQKLRSIKDVKQARKFKANNFDYVTFSGIFKKRNDKALKQHSKLLTIDFDHISDVQDLKLKLLNDNYFDTEMLFVSPSGNGLKWIIEIDISKISHSDYFLAVANYINHTYGAKVDPSGKDVSRACFLPHDPLPYLNKKHHKI